MQQRQQTGGRSRAYLYLGLSLVAAVIAAVLVIQIPKTADRRVDAAVNKKTDTVDVVVATRNLYMGLPMSRPDRLYLPIATVTRREFLRVCRCGANGPYLFEEQRPGKICPTFGVPPATA